MGATWHGLDAFTQQLQTLPTDLTTAAQPIVQQSAEEAGDVMRARYPVVTGRLRDSVVVRELARKRTETNVSWLVANTAPYAHFVEYGTRSTPPRPVFIATRNQKRRDMYAALKAMLPRFNLKARGDVE